MFILFFGKCKVLWEKKIKKTLISITQKLCWGCSCAEPTIRTRKTLQSPVQESKGFAKGDSRDTESLG